MEEEKNCLGTLLKKVKVTRFLVSKGNAIITFHLTVVIIIVMAYRSGMREKQ
jgi:hypothetical protein